jgi:hypothetical protein
LAQQQQRRRRRLALDTWDLRRRTGHHPLVLGFLGLQARHHLAVGLAGCLGPLDQRHPVLDCLGQLILHPSDRKRHHPPALKLVVFLVLLAHHHLAVGSLGFSGQVVQRRQVVDSLDLQAQHRRVDFLHPQMRNRRALGLEAFLDQQAQHHLAVDSLDQRDHHLS